MKNEYEILSSSCQRFYAIDFFLLKRYSVRTINIMEPPALLPTESLHPKQK